MDESNPDNDRTDDSIDEVNENEGGDDDDEDSEEQKNRGDSTELVQQRIQYLREDIQQAPYNFSSYVDLIKILRDQGELNEIRTLREKLSQLFPLQEDIWLEWLMDEQRMAVTEEEELNVISLYERSVQDYLSVKIWLQWTQWQEKLGEEKNQVDLVRQRYEQALTHTGLHLVEGHRVWDAYINFEKGLLESLEDSHSQLERIRKLYQRSLSIPLKQMEDRMNDYKSWEKSLGTEAHDCTFMDQYNTALLTYKERTQFEDVISESDPNSPDYDQINKWWEYIRFEEEKNDISRVRCLYERAIKNYFLVTDLWTSYIKYLQTNMKNVSKVILAVCARSVRNWPYTYRLWCTYLQELERAKRPISEINEVFERGLVQLSVEDDIFEIYKQYIDYNARALHNTTEDEKANLITNLRAACSRSVDYFTQSFPNSPNLENLIRHWALLEGELIKDSNSSQRLFEILFKNYSKRAEYWIDAVRVLKSFLQYNQCRNLFKRACNVVSSDPQSIWTEWESFERIHGTLEDYHLASERIEARHLEVTAAAEAAQQTSTSVEGEKKKKKTETPKTRRDSRKDRSNNEISGDKKKPFLKRKQDREDVAFNAKRQKNVSDHALPKGRPKVGRFYDSRTVHVSNLPDTTTKEKLKEIFETIGPVVDVRFPPSKFKGFAYVEFENESGSSQAIARGADKATSEGIKYDHVVLNVAPAFAIRPGAVVPPPPPVVAVPKRVYSEELTLFVNNLAYTTTEEELEAAMMTDETVSIRQVRLVRDQHSGRSKGFAYVQFNDKESLDKGLAANGKILHNFSMRVAISKPPKPKTEEMNIDTDIKMEKEVKTEVKTKEEKETFAVPKRLMPRVVKKQVGALSEKSKEKSKEEKKEKK